MVKLLDAVAASGVGTARAVGSANQNMAVISSAAGAAGTTVTIESSIDNTNWITELSVVAPSASPVAATNRVYIPAVNWIRGNVTAYSAGSITVTLQSWAGATLIN
jgi:hypothetical protein